MDNESTKYFKIVFKNIILDYAFNCMP